MGAEEIYRAARDAFDISLPVMMEQQEIQFVGCEITRPSVLFRPRIFIDGNKWCALYGENIQDGVAGFGNSPDEAMRDFDAHWHGKIL